MSEATKKTVSAYNESQLAYLLASYVPEMDVQDLVAGVNERANKGDSPKNKRSIVAKLSNMRDGSGEKIYIAPPKVVGGASPERKLHLTRQIEAFLEVEKGSLISLEKANKPALELLIEELAKITYSNDCKSDE